MEDSVGLVGDSYVIRFPDMAPGWKKITKSGDPKLAREFVEKDMVNKILNDSTRPKQAWIVIILGGGDIPNQTDSKIVQDLYSIAVGFKNKGLTPFICEINPISNPRKPMTPAEYKTRTNNINKTLKDSFIAKGWEYDVVVNLPDIEISEDGCHPTDKGFKDLKQAIVTHIATFKQKIISWSLNELLK
ncbi:unnamed protein product [Meganyctiphanes norvegica]|uniref:SGNH hydrolase-type esterase domain-containing protein n=1 Tax=Meganyctiphanes norvegica TaxID=48144 RepID=A0AAV2SGP3_MEGNR